MLNTAQLQTVLFFPFRDAAARKNFLIACILMVASFIIPILPSLAVMGYAARIMRQVIDERREPTMPEWDDWKSLLKDGLRIWGFWIVVVVPFLLVMVVGVFIVLIMMAIGTAAGNSSSELSPILFISFVVYSFFMMLFFLIAIPIGIAIMASTCHIVEKQSFTAGFAFKEWWPIFRSNLMGFIVTYLLYMSTTYMFSFAVQILMFTIILICVLPFVIIVFMGYVGIVPYVLFAYAYRDGSDRLVMIQQEAIAASSN